MLRLVLLVLSLSLAAGAAHPDYPDSHPDTPTVTVDAEDTNYNPDVVTIDLLIEVPNTGFPTCGYDVQFGLSDTDMTGPLVNSSLRNASGYTPGDTLSLTLTDAITRLVPPGTTAGDVYPQVASSAGADGNTVQTVSYPGDALFMSDSGSYKVLVFAMNCEANPAFNPTPGAADVTDNAAPLFFPLVSDSEHSSVFTFTDTSNVEGTFSGDLVIYVDTSAESLFTVSEYRVYEETLCTTGACVASGTDPSYVAFTGSNGVYTASLTDFTPADGNQFVLVAVVTIGTDNVLSVEREIRVVDLVPAATGDLPGETQNTVTLYTPEKSIDTTTMGPPELNLNYADNLILDSGVNFTSTGKDTTGQGVVITYSWLVDPGTGTYVTLPSTPANYGSTYGPLFMLPTLSGNYKATAQAYDYTGTTPWISEQYETDVLSITVSASPQAPELAVPGDVNFTDTDGTHDVIAGDVTFTPRANVPTTAEDTRQFEYYLVYLSVQDACTVDTTDPFNFDLITCAAGTGRDVNNDERLGVVAYDSTLTSYTFTLTATATSGSDFIHVTAYETAGQGAETQMTGTVAVVDTQQDIPSALPVSVTVSDATDAMGVLDDTVAPKFYDMNGANRVIAGVVEFSVDGTTDFSGIGTFEVFLHDSATYTSASELGTAIATVDNPATALTATDRVSIWLGTDNSDWTTPEADPSATFNLDNGNAHYTHLIIVARSSSDGASGVELGLVLASAGAAIEIEDRVDSYYFVEHLASNTGTCPAALCPSGSPTSDTRFWPYAEQAEGSTNGKVSIFWLTAALDETLYELDDASTPARELELLDNVALDDMSAIFSYRVALGGSTSNPKCALNNDANWPHGAPDAWEEQVDMTNRELFHIQADYNELRACGFTERTTKSEVVLEGLVTLFLDPVAATLPANSLSSGEPELSLQAALSVTFADETHAVTSAVSVDNVLVVVESGSANELTAEVTVASELQLYSEAFIQTVDPAQFVFVSGTDRFYVEHALTSNQDSLYLTLNSMWFSTGSSLSDSVEFFVPQSSSAYQNVDTPALPGRFRSSLVVPYLMNCKPCYMHAVSTINSSAAKSLLKQAPEVTRSTQIMYVDVSNNPLTDFVEDSAASSCSKSLLAGSVAALVVARM